MVYDESFRHFLRILYGNPSDPTDNALFMYIVGGVSEIKYVREWRYITSQVGGIRKRETFIFLLYQDSSGVDRGLRYAEQESALQVIFRVRISRN